VLLFSVVGAKTVALNFFARNFRLLFPVIAARHPNPAGFET
jgi:hypothetical protein